MNEEMQEKISLVLALVMSIVCLVYLKVFNPYEQPKISGDEIDFIKSHKDDRTKYQKQADVFIEVENENFEILFQYLNNGNLRLWEKRFDSFDEGKKVFIYKKVVLNEFDSSKKYIVKTTYNHVERDVNTSFTYTIEVNQYVKYKDSELIDEADFMFNKLNYKIKSRNVIKI